MAETFPILYLPAKRHADGITTIAMNPKNQIICLHTWFARFYSMPSWIVRRIEPSQGMQKARIDAVIREAYALREVTMPSFDLADQLAFFGNKLIRWLIKVPQRILRWPHKLRLRLSRRKMQKRRINP
jgi:hypothetical protein